MFGYPGYRQKIAEINKGAKALTKLQDRGTSEFEKAFIPQEELGVKELEDGNFAPVSSPLNCSQPLSLFDPNTQVKISPLEDVRLSESEIRELIKEKMMSLQEEASSAHQESLSHVTSELNSSFNVSPILSAKDLQLAGQVNEWEESILLKNPNASLF